MTHPSRIHIGIVLLPLALLWAACGGTSDDAEDQPSSATTVSRASADTTGPGFNLNTATGEDFRTIPNVGDRMVREFFEYRPYVSIRQFREEIGKYVSSEQVAAYEQYVYVPVDFNESDAATLQQLPGVDGAVADELIAGRPYESKAAFLEALRAHVSEDELPTAETYLKAQ